MKEADLVTKIIKGLRARGFWAVKLHGGPMQQAGLPDVLAVKAGRAFFLEVKLPGGNATRLQESVMRDLRDVGAVAATVHSLEEVLQAVGNP